MSLTMSDFYDRGDGYLARRLDDSDMVEVVRADGYGFGAVPEDYVDRLVARDVANPKPSTGYTLAGVLGEAGPTQVSDDPASHPAVHQPAGPALASGDPTNEAVMAEIAKRVSEDPVASSEDTGEAPAEPPARSRRSTATVTEEASAES